MRHTIKRSRARNGWLHAHRLSMLDIATAKPLAYIEKRKGPLIWKSYLITEYVEGPNLFNFLRDNSATQQQRSKVTQHIAELFEKLQKNRITHGDLKHSNILVTNQALVLTDLDSMKVHKCSCTWKLAGDKDARRLAICLPDDNI